VQVASNARLDELKKRIEREPESRLFAQLAEELRRAGELPEAIAVARKGLEKHASYVSARITLGRALLDSGDLNGAVSEFGEVVRIAPENIIGCRSLGDCLERLGDLGSAVAWYRETLRIAPGDPSSLAKVEELTSRMAAASAGRPSGEAVGGTTAGADVAADEAATVLVGVAAGEAPLPVSEVDESVEFEGGAPAAHATESVYVGEVEGIEYGAGELSVGPADSGAGAASDAEPVAAASGGVAEVADGELASPTLAELYYQQGSPDRAAEIYRQLLARDPRNEGYRSRLIEIAEIQAEMAGGGRTAGAQAASAAGAAGRRSTIERQIQALDELLAAVQRARQ
jgi:tetratricopeptide (TPR) repeat protein